MSLQSALRTLLVAALCSSAAAQVFNLPGSTDRFTSATALDAIQAGRMDFSIFTINSRAPNTTPLQTPSGSVSLLDLKAPGKAKREYDKGYQLLLRKDLQGAMQHLETAVAIYPKYVGAHNALGTAYLDNSQNERARDEFQKAIALDDHLANSYLNLGCANLALQKFSGAEDAFRKASELAPMDLEILQALSYAEYVNKDYPAVLATASQVHERKHDGAAIVHYFAAAALVGQNNLTEALQQMELLLEEDPTSESASLFRTIQEGMKQEQARREELKLHPPEPVTFSFNSTGEPTSEEAQRQAREVLQDVKERNQIAEAESAPTGSCDGCPAGPVDPGANSKAGREMSARPLPGLFHASVDEVAILFTATDRGKPVMDLTSEEVALRDAGKPPAAILGFRNESQLPLRLGLVIDTSDSIASRFAFEKAAANKFVQGVVTNQGDLGFVVGVNNSVLMVQDFTPEQSLLTRAVDQLAPGGGTALWDAVWFAADKLSRRSETQAVARILVVISDGRDNSSTVTLKQAIATAMRGEVAVYTVSTRDVIEEQSGSRVGDQALSTLSGPTGGAAFVPGSVHQLTKTLAELEQVIRARYLVSYKPAAFERNGQYRAVELTAQKAGHPLRVYARKGYYAVAAQKSAE